MYRAEYAEDSVNRFSRWSEDDVWSNLFALFQDADLQYIMIDATIVRAHACAADARKNAIAKMTGIFTQYGADTVLAGACSPASVPKGSVCFLKQFWVA